MGLTIFNESNGIYPGVNEPQFAQLEYLINTTKEVNTIMPSLGLFGEASTGKTMTANIIAKEVDCNFVFLNGTELSLDALNDTLYDTIGYSLDYGKTFIDINENMDYRIQWRKTVKPLVVLLDEAHALPKGTQTALLSIIDNKGPLINDTDRCSVITDNMTWIFATTDSSKLLYPLTTRLFPIIFDQYSPEDIMNIIKMKYKTISDTGLRYLANCSKLVPRVALRYAEQLTKINPTEQVPDAKVEAFIKGFLNMELTGIDPIDKRVLLYLANNKKAVNPSDEVLLTGFKSTLARLEKKGVNNLSSAEHREYNKCLFNISNLEQTINSAEYIAKSRQDISLACRCLDMNDLETRLSFLEKLNMVSKTPKGIMLSEAYLN